MFLLKSLFKNLLNISKPRKGMQKRIWKNEFPGIEITVTIVSPRVTNFSFFKKWSAVNSACQELNVVCSESGSHVTP